MMLACCCGCGCFDPNAVGDAAFTGLMVRPLWFVQRFGDGTCIARPPATFEITMPELAGPLLRGCDGLIDMLWPAFADGLFVFGPLLTFTAALPAALTRRIATGTGRCCCCCCWTDDVAVMTAFDAADVCPRTARTVMFGLLMLAPAETVGVGDVTFMVRVTDGDDVDDLAACSLASWLSCVCAARNRFALPSFWVRSYLVDADADEACCLDAGAVG